MKNISRLLGSNRRLGGNNTLVHQQTSEKYTRNFRTLRNSLKEKHPYKNIHPWKSVDEFSESLVKNVLYNKDGLVAINKPYGIASRNPDENDKKSRYLRESLNKISGGVDYTIANSLPFIAKQLGYEKLTVVKAPERYMSGVTLLAADESVEKAVLISEKRAVTLKKMTKSYWVITTRVCKEPSGHGKLALKLFKSPCKKYERPVILNTWSGGQVKRQEIKPLLVEHKVLSNAKKDLGSLIEIKASTRKWHSIRLFAAAKLHCPILGDNIHGSRVQNIMGTWMTVNPFLDTVSRPPILDDELLKALNLSNSMQPIIPVHIHLKQIELLHHLGRKKHLVIQAPLFPEFSWTIQTLGYELPVETDSKSDEVRTEEEQKIVQICQ